MLYLKNTERLFGTVVGSSYITPLDNYFKETLVITYVNISPHIYSSKIRSFRICKLNKL